MEGVKKTFSDKVWNRWSPSPFHTSWTPKVTFRRQISRPCNTWAEDRENLRMRISTNMRRGWIRECTWAVWMTETHVGLCRQTTAPGNKWTTMLLLILLLHILTAQIIFQWKKNKKQTNKRPRQQMDNYDPPSFLVVLLCIYTCSDHTPVIITYSSPSPCMSAFSYQTPMVKCWRETL